MRSRHILLGVVVIRAVLLPIHLLRDVRAPLAVLGVLCTMRQPLHFSTSSRPRDIQATVPASHQSPAHPPSRLSHSSLHGSHHRHRCLQNLGLLSAASSPVTIPPARGLLALCLQSCRLRHFVTPENVTTNNEDTNCTHLGYCYGSFNCRLAKLNTAQQKLDQSLTKA